MILTSVCMSVGQVAEVTQKYISFTYVSTVFMYPAVAHVALDPLVTT